MPESFGHLSDVPPPLPDVLPLGDIDGLVDLSSRGGPRRRRRACPSRARSACRR